MKFNKQILKKNLINGLTNKDLVKVLKTKIDYLILHNKNYTKNQYYELQDIANIIGALEA